MNIPEIYLCSTSPRRQSLLNQIGASFKVISIQIDETQLTDELPKSYALRMAQQKALAGAKVATENLPILSADTIAVSDNRILCKPKDKTDFLAMLSHLSDKTHTVITAIALYHQNQFQTTWVETEVTFRAITQDEMEHYWQHYHPIDKAGGYGIQDFAAVFVKSIKGSYSNVVGLPLTETYELLTKL